MNKHHIKSEVRQLGQYDTPIETANYIVKRVINIIKKSGGNIDEKLFLDPCVGDGVFYQALNNYNIEKKNITLQDIDKSVFKNLSDNNETTILVSDFLKSQDGNYDVILGNPPYKSPRKSEYLKQHKEEIKSKFGKFAYKNMYVTFMMTAHQKLRTGGLLAFIVQDSFLTNNYYEEFRNFILNNFQVIEVLLAPLRLFHHTNADVKTVIIIAKKLGADETFEYSLFPEENPFIFRSVGRISDQSEYMKPEIEYYVSQSLVRQFPRQRLLAGISPEMIQYYIKLSTKSAPLGDLYGGGTGISTGNDKRFIIKQEEKPDGDFVPFYRNPGGNQFYYEPDEWIARDWRQNEELGNSFMVRNSQFYLQEGVSCSSMGVRFSAVRMEEDSLFGINPTFFHQDDDYRDYLLGFLNTELASYFCRGLLNRTNMITSSYIKELPLIIPEQSKMTEVVNVVDKLYTIARQYDGTIDQSEEGKELNEHLNDLFYDIYDTPIDLIAEIKYFNENIMELI